MRSRACLFLQGVALLLCVPGVASSHADVIAAAAEPTAVTIAIPQGEEPVMDGHITPEEWADAAVLTGTIGRGKTLASRQSIFFMKWRPDAVLLAARTYFRPGMQAMTRNRASTSDTLEISVFAPDSAAKDAAICHFFVFPNDSPNELEMFSPYTHEFIRSGIPSGTIIQSVATIELDPEETLGAGTRRWETEIRVPLAAFMRQKPLTDGETVCLVLGRNFGNSVEQTYIPVVNGYFDPTGFVQGHLTSAKPVTRLSDIRPLTNGTGALALSLAQAGPQPLDLEVNYGFSKDVGSPPLKVTLPASGHTKVDLPIPSETKGDFSLEITDANGQRLFSFRAPFEVRPLETTEWAGQVPQLERVVVAMNDGTYLIKRLESGLETRTRLTYRKGGGAIPRLMPGDDKILLTSAEGGKDSIWLLEDNGRTQTQLVAGRDAAWLPDGTGFVFERDGQLYCAALAGNKVERTADIAPQNISDCRYPVVSPAAPHRIAFVVDGATLMQSDLDGTNAAVLATGDISGAPAWSPDGKWLAFQDGPNLWIVDGKGQRQLAVGGVGVKSHPVWEADGKAIAACFAPAEGLPTEWRAFGVGCADITESINLLPTIDGPADGVWHFANAPKPVAVALAPVTAESVMLGQTSAGVVTLSGDSKSMATCVQKRLTGYRIQGLSDQQALTVKGPLAQVILVDRLGRDVAIEPRDNAVPLGFAPLLVCPLTDGKGMVIIANPSGEANIEATWQEEQWLLTIGNCAQPVAVGFADGEGAVVWQHPAASGDAMSAVEGVWRFVGGEGAAPVAQAGIPASPESRPGYLFARTADSPLRGLSVTDVVEDLCGTHTAAREAVLQARACLDFRVAPTPTLYPTIGIYMDGLEQSIGKEEQFSVLVKDFPDWFIDIKALLDAMDSRLDEYATAAKSLGVIDQSELTKARAGFVKVDALQEAEADMLSGEKKRSQAYLKLGRKAASDRGKWLQRCREETVAARVAAMKACLTAPSPEAHAAAVARWHELGQVLANRQFDEEGWLGETPQFPFMKPFWQGNMWRY